MLDQLNAAEQEALSSLEALADSDALDAWYKRYLGKKGSLTLMLRSVGDLPKEERPAFGRAANELKTRLDAAYQARSQVLSLEKM